MKQIFKVVIITTIVSILTIGVNLSIPWASEEKKHEVSTIPPAPVIDEDIVILRKYEIESKRVTVYYDRKTRTICHITDAGDISCLPYQPALWPNKSKNYIREMLQKNRKEVKEEKTE
jgi:hypothetical protein